MTRNKKNFDWVVRNTLDSMQLIGFGETCSELTKSMVNSVQCVITSYQVSLGFVSWNYSTYLISLFRTEKDV